MSADAFGNQPAMTPDEMFEAGLVTSTEDDCELTLLGYVVEATCDRVRWTPNQLRDLRSILEGE